MHVCRKKKYILFNGAKCYDIQVFEEIHRKSHFIEHLYYL